MKPIHRLPLIAALALSVGVGFAPPARAAGVGTDFWLAGGFTKPSYNVDILACLRGGLGVDFLGRFSVGASTQVDRERYFYFAYAGVVLPRLGVLEPYARFHVGRRDDVDDTALGWSAGFRVGNGVVNLFIEGHGILEPGYGDGASVGLSF